MLKTGILILSFLLPLVLFSQEMEQEGVSEEVPIGSSGIDLFPEEEISTPTEPSPEVTAEPSQEPAAPEPVPEPAPVAAPEPTASEMESPPHP